MIDISVDLKPGRSLRLLVFQAIQLYPSHALIPFLNDRTDIVRTAAARELQIRGEVETFDLAEKMIKSRRSLDRDLGAFLLGQLGTPRMPYKKRSVPLLIPLLTDRSALVRESAASALGHLQAKEAIAALVAASDDPVADVRRGVASALISFPRNKAARLCLRKLANDIDEDVRYWATVDG